MYTIIETPTFKADADTLWTEEERGAFCAWLAADPEAGDVVPGSGNIPAHLLKAVREVIENE